MPLQKAFWQKAKEECYIIIPLRVRRISSFPNCFSMPVHGSHEPDQPGCCSAFCSAILLSIGFSFFGITLLGGFSFSLVFTFLSAIAARAQQNAGLMVIMGFPIIIPQILLTDENLTHCFFGHYSKRASANCSIAYCAGCPRRCPGFDIISFFVERLECDLTSRCRDRFKSV